MRVRLQLVWIVGSLVLLVAPAARAASQADSVVYRTAITTINRVGMTITNYGFIGNNFTSRSPSFEFPLGSGYEHMSRAGLWVGGYAIGDTGVYLGVSAAIVDNAQGSNALAETEFTPAGNAIVQRSRIANSPRYSPDAISDQDFDCAYSDRPGRLPSGYQMERHVPINILVEQKVLSFSLQAADAFVVFRYTIVNLGQPLRDLYVGMYAQPVSGDKDAYSSWPPSASSGPGSWYYNTYAAYDRDRRMYEEHYCAGLPFPDACNFGYTPPWVGVKLLSTSPGPVDGRTVSLNWWSYSPGDTLRDTDAERYAILSNGMVMDPTECTPGAAMCSPIMELSVGPFTEIDPGDSVTVTYAFIGGDDFAHLLINADFAQFASDIDFKLPAPPPSPRLRVVPGARRLDVYWDDSPESVSDPTSEAPGGLDFEGYRVYAGLDRNAPTRVAQFDVAAPPHDTTGFNTGFDAVRLDPPRVFDGIPYRYHYVIDGLRDGFNYYGAVTSYDLGDPRVESLESGISQNKFQAVPSPAPRESGQGVTVFPNPYRVEARWDQGAQVRDHYLWFANLPARAVLRIYTLAGDLVREVRFDGAGYRGEGTRGLYNPAQDLDTPPPRLSGASYAWDMITDEGQAVATGLYIFSVEDLDSGGLQRGKFLIVKSDREN